MPGKILKILVDPGSEVNNGDPLIVVEAMKMEQTIRAHSAGIVDEILAKPGQVIAPGQMLVRLRPKDNL